MGAIVACVALVLNTGSAVTQSWPYWADELFGRPGDESQEERVQGFTRGPFSRKRISEDDVRHGGPRPAIAAIGAPTVPFAQGFAPDAIVIVIEERKLYYVLADNRAHAYSIGVGREGFGWTGTEVVSRKQAWPDWHPPPEMRERDPSLPKKMTGGSNNPLGAMALYLGTTLYRIHGTNDGKSIGRAESSGCFRMLNSAVLHLASITQIGTPVTVVTALPRPQVSSAPTDPPGKGEARARVSVTPSDPNITPQRLPDYRSLREQTLKTP